jgi:hypothetical protein
MPTIPGTTQSSPEEGLLTEFQFFRSLLEQIQALLGHSSVQTTERYLGTKQDLAHAPNDVIKLKLAV